MNLIQALAAELGKDPRHVENVVHLLDEGNTITPECADVLHSLTDAARQIQVPGYGLMQMHPHSAFTITMNEDYAGTNFMNEATIDRFTPIHIAEPESIVDVLHRVVPEASAASLNICDSPSAGPAPAPEAPQHDSAADDEDDEPQDTIPQALGRGVFGMFKWLLLVVLFVLIIAGGGVAWLYRSATPDMLPEVKVTFDGQELAPTAYKWHVPVVGSFFRRTYAETLNSSPVVLEDAISDASPDIIVTPSDYSTQLTITDADKETVYEGSATAFRSYLFAENGTFDAKLVVTALEG